MPRTRPNFRHVIKWAPDDPNINEKYGARVQSVSFKSGRVTIEWSIYRAYTKGKNKEAK